MSEIIGNAERRLVMLVQEDDQCPIDVWLDGIRDTVTRARVIRQIDKLSRGLGVQKGLKGVAELKIDIGPGYRVYYAFLEQKTLIVLLGGGNKSSQRRDIIEARRLWEEFEKGGRSLAALRAWREAQPKAAEDHGHDIKEFR